MDEPRVHEQSDDGQSDDEHHDQSVSDDEYQVGNDTDPGEFVQAEHDAGVVDDDQQPNDEDHDQPAIEHENHGAYANAEDDSEIEFYESYEELKEEPLEMEPIREPLDITDNSDCALAIEYKIEIVEQHDQPASEDENHDGNGDNPEAEHSIENENVDDEFLDEFSEPFEELKEEPYGMEPLRESLDNPDNPDNSDCILISDWNS